MSEKWHTVYVKVLDEVGVPVGPPAVARVRRESTSIRAAATVGKRGGEPRLVIRVWPAAAAVDRLLNVRRALRELGYGLDDSDASAGVVRELAARGVPWPAGGSFAAVLDRTEPPDVPPGLTSDEVLDLMPPEYGDDPDA